MQLDPYIQALREDLARIAVVGDESTARAADLLAVALESSLARRMQEMLAEAAMELSSQLEDGRVEVRMAGGDPELVYVDEATSSAGQTDPSDAVFSARITLRLPEHLKTKLEAAAAAQGVSVNAWLVQVLGRALGSRPPSTTNRNRLTGYGRT
jgi:hypothetical protein